MQKKATYTFIHKISSIVMLCALAWLTVCLPIVYADQQLQKQTAQEQRADVPVEKNSNPLSDTNEERSEGGSNTLSEYLHDHPSSQHQTLVIEQNHKCHSSELYFAYHPELISPPPEV